MDDCHNGPLSLCLSTAGCGRRVRLCRLYDATVRYLRQQSMGAPAAAAASSGRGQSVCAAVSQESQEPRPPSPLGRSPCVPTRGGTQLATPAFVWRPAPAAIGTDSVVRHGGPRWQPAGRPRTVAAGALRQRRDRAVEMTAAHAVGR